MAEFQELLDFPPAPKLNVEGKLDPRTASASELRSQEIFLGKGRCTGCYPGPYYTDNLMHNLRCQCRDKTPAILPVLPTTTWAGTW
jgi:hypothetical protein